MKCSFLAGLDGGFGHFSGSLDLLHSLDHTDGDGLSHVTHGETSERGVLGEGLHAHRLGGGHENNGGVTRFDLLGEVFHFLTRSAIDLFLEFSELAGDMGGVAIQDWRVTVSNFSWVVHDDDLSGESLGFLGGVIFGVRCDVSTSDILNGDVLDVETNVVTGSSFWKRFVVHLNRLDFSGNVDWGESNNHSWFDDTSFDSTDWHSSNTTDFVDILEWKSEWFV